ncbi:hypothetical protein Micbo1qcDRAFT_112830, partial [Microdochium bolleyi]
VATAPPGVTPDFYSFTSLQLRLTIIFGITYIMATLLLGLRLYTGLFLVKRLGFDALLLVCSWGFSGGFFFVMAQSFPAGFGRHIWDVNYHQLQDYLNMLRAFFILYLWPTTCVKLSVLLIYHQINPHMVFRYCGICVAIFTIAPTIVYTALLIDTCDPRKGDPTCLNSIALVQTGTNIASDLLIIAMPIQMTIRLNMPIRQKVTVGALLTLGSLCVIFPIIRTSFIQQFLTDPDVTWRQGDVSMWAILETNFGVICNSLAMLQPFVRRHMPGL